MTDLTPRELVDAITRSLSETWQRMAAKYRGAAPDQPAREPRALESVGNGQGEAAGSRSSDRS